MKLLFPQFLPRDLVGGALRRAHARENCVSDCVAATNRSGTPKP